VQSQPDVAQPGTGRIVKPESRREPGAVVPHPQVQHAVFEHGTDLEAASARLARDAVAECVFDQRLQQKRGNLAGFRLGRDADAHIEAVTEAELLQVDVASHQPDLRG
jgi:hypothetical protein